MRKFLMISAAAAAITLAAPIASMAQGVAIDTPVGGVRIGEPHHYYHPSWGYAAPRYDRDDSVVVEKRVYHDRGRHEWRDRDVGLRRWDRDRRDRD
jgi:hypothetical protein